MMYYYWKNGRVKPSVFYSMPRGELTVIQAFYEMEIAENNQTIKEAEKSKSTVYSVPIRI